MKRIITISIVAFVALFALTNNAEARGVYEEVISNNRNDRIVENIFRTIGVGIHCAATTGKEVKQKEKRQDDQNYVSSSNPNYSYGGVSFEQMSQQSQEIKEARARKIERENQSLKEKLVEKNTELEKVKVESAEQAKKIQELETQNAELKKQVSIIQGQLATVQKQLAENKTELAETRKELSEIKILLVSLKQELQVKDEFIRFIRPQLEQIQK